MDYNYNNQQGKTGKNGKKLALPNKASLYDEFILWSAMPPMEQRRLGIETQTAFCEFYHIGHNQTSVWKNRPDFQERRTKILALWAKDRTPAVIQGIFASAVKGNSDSQRIWLKYFEDWQEDKPQEIKIRVRMAPEDLRFVVDGMPDEYKQKFYGYITEIIDTAVALRNSRGLQDGNTNSLFAEDEIPDETDNDASDLSDSETCEVSARHPSSLCSDLETHLFQDNYQGSARWWQKRIARDGWI